VTGNKRLLFSLRLLQATKKHKTPAKAIVLLHPFKSNALLHRLPVSKPCRTGTPAIHKVGWQVFTQEIENQILTFFKNNSSEKEL
jgi:hypothetical protein